MIGAQIGVYRIERMLGRGGFGVVYLAVDTRLGRRAAVKQLLPELSNDRAIVERFFNEAKAAANINHPGIVEIYDVGWHSDGSAFFAMKLLTGESLAQRLRTRGPLSIQIAATIARQIASALAAAHAGGIVHRDLKPDNIMLVPDDEVAFGERATVLDFGIAKLSGDHPLSQKTSTGMMMGTPWYMSPEQCRGAGEVDRRTDIYALGCIVFEMLTGRPPFTGEGLGEVLGKHQYVEPPLLRSLRPEIAELLESIVARTLAKSPAQRFQEMPEVAAALKPFATTISGERLAQPTPQPVNPLAGTFASTSGVASTVPPTVNPVASAPDMARSAPTTPLIEAAPITPAPTPLTPAPSAEMAPNEMAREGPRRRMPLVVLGVAGVAAIAVAVVIVTNRGERAAGDVEGATHPAVVPRVVEPSFDQLAVVARSAPTQAGLSEQLAAIRALAKHRDRARAADVLVEIARREIPIKGAMSWESSEIASAAIDGLGELRDRRSIAPLIELLYRELVRKPKELKYSIVGALVVQGSEASSQFRKVLRGEHVEVNQLFKDQQLDRSCSADKCIETSSKDALAAEMLGELRDRTATPDLLVALQRPSRLIAAEAWSQHIEIINALGVIGAREAAPALGRLLNDRKLDPYTRIAVIETIPYVAPAGDDVTRRLAAIAADESQPGKTRYQAERALANLSTSENDIASFVVHARQATTNDFRDARFYVQNIARIEVATRCKDDVLCYADTLAMSGAAVAKKVFDAIRSRSGGTVPFSWEASDDGSLLEAAVDRAMIELGKRGVAEARVVDKLLAKLPDHLERLSYKAILLALPKIAAMPCDRCVERLDALQSPLRDGKDSWLASEIRIVRDYFRSARER